MDAMTPDEALAREIVDENRYGPLTGSKALVHYEDLVEHIAAALARVRGERDGALNEIERAVHIEIEHVRVGGGDPLFSLRAILKTVQTERAALSAPPARGRGMTTHLSACGCVTYRCERHAAPPTPPAPDAVSQALREIADDFDNWAARDYDNGPTLQFVTHKVTARLRFLAASRAPKVIAPHDPNCAQWLGGKCDCD